MRIQISKAEISLDWESAAHFIFGILAVFLSREWLFTAIFALKQCIDYHSGEDSSEVGGDIVEFVAGIILALILMRGVS